MENGNVPATLLDENGHPSPKYQAYAQYRQAHQSSVEAYNNAYAAALASPAQLQIWPMRGKVYQAAVDAALNDWLAAGHKAEVERAMQAPPP